MKICYESIPYFHFLNADFTLLALNWYLQSFFENGKGPSIKIQDFSSTKTNEAEFQGLSRPKNSRVFKTLTNPVFFGMRTFLRSN